MSRQMYHFFDSQQPFVLGVASAMLILFFVSGEAFRGVTRWRELKKEIVMFAIGLWVFTEKVQNG